MRFKLRLCDSLTTLLLTFVEDTPKSCLDVLVRGKTSDGVYMIDPDGRGAFPAYCDQTTDDGGWTVLQRRFSGSVDFDTTWERYRDGFGDKYGEHWLGLEHISRITKAAASDMRIDMEAWDGSTHYTVYWRFSIGDEKNYYPINFGFHKGPGTDGLLHHNYDR